MDRTYTVADLQVPVNGFPVVLRRYGAAGWTKCNGEPNFFRSRDAADRAGVDWVENGRKS